jgi:hypothetical protein
MKTPEPEYIDIIKIKGEYHWKPYKNKKYRTHRVPKSLFLKYAHTRSEFYRALEALENAFKEKKIKDVPFTVAKNHVQEDEIHKFHDNGSVTITSRNETDSVN